MKEKKFVPKLGQVDFTNIRWAPVLNCVVMFQDQMLLVQRSSGMRLYPGYWNGISGFLDDKKSLEQKVEEELREELGISKKHILSIKLGRIMHQDAPKYKKTWIVHPVLVKIDTDKVNIDWEAQNFKWLKPSQTKKLKLLPGFEEVIQEVLKLRK
jgi:isopentenyldiphosphate isomerase